MRRIIFPHGCKEDQEFCRIHCIKKRKKLKKKKCL